VAVAAAAIAVGVVESGSSVHPTSATDITQTAIGMTPLGHTHRWYADRLGGYKGYVLTNPPGYPAMSFEQPGVAVYFPRRGANALAHIITTWNPTFRTADGIGPCSTLERMHRVYGKRAAPFKNATSPNGKVHFAWELGHHILFETQDQKTISTVVLYKGPHQGWAHYVGANETACT
jgi:hypothetical protein